MSDDKALARIQSAEVALTEDISVSRVLAQATAVQQLMQNMMKPDVHYGVIPGTQGKDGKAPKNTLLQPGADLLCMLFRMRPKYSIISKTETEGRIAFTVRCRLVHITAGWDLGEGVGSANSRESRYLNQATAKLCPECQKPAIIAGKEEYGGGWLCYRKKDGCGAKFGIDDERIVGQSGVVNNDKVWDLHNTILKIANKRAKVAAVLTATAASDIFTQDLEDLHEAFANSPKVTYQNPTPESQAKLDELAAKNAATLAAPRPERAAKAPGKATRNWSATPTPAPEAAKAETPKEQSASSSPNASVAVAPAKPAASATAMPATSAAASTTNLSSSPSPESEKPAGPKPSAPTAPADREAGSDDGDLDDMGAGAEELDPSSDEDLVECFKQKGGNNGPWESIGPEPRRNDKQNKQLHALFADLELKKEDDVDVRGKERPGIHSRLRKLFGKWQPNQEPSTADLSAREADALIVAMKKRIDQNRKLYGWGTAAERRKLWEDRARAEGRTQRPDGTWAAPGVDPETGAPL